MYTYINVHVHVCCSIRGLWNWLDIGSTPLQRRVEFWRVTLSHTPLFHHPTLCKRGSLAQTIIVHIAVVIEGRWAFIVSLNGAQAEKEEPVCERYSGTPGRAWLHIPGGGRELQTIASVASDLVLLISTPILMHSRLSFFLCTMYTELQGNKILEVAILW